MTNLPSDVDVEEVASVFSKCGMIAENMESKQPRIKLYIDDHGRFKGDALIVYFRAESVNLAVQMLDDTDLRPGSSGPAGRMRVAAADFSYKTQKEAPAKQTDREKQKIIKKTQKLNRYVASRLVRVRADAMLVVSLPTGTTTTLKRCTHLQNGIKW